jgi:hypothetical protein
MSDNQTPPRSPAEEMVAIGNPAGVMTAATVGIITVLVRELIKTGAVQGERFLADLEDLAAMPLAAPQTPDENRMEKKVFDLVRLAVQSAQKELP